MKEDFNVEKPIPENIEWAFKNLLFYITASSKLEIYKSQREKFKNCLAKANKILEEYLKQNKLSLIKEETLKDLKYDLMDLDIETQNLNSYYAEWSLLWIDAIISLRTSEMKKCY